MDLSTLLTTDMDPRSHAAASMLLLQAGGTASGRSTDCDSGASMTSSDGARTPRSVQAPHGHGGCGGGGGGCDHGATGGRRYGLGHSLGYSQGGALGGSVHGGVPAGLGPFAPPPPPAGDAGGGLPVGMHPPPPSTSGASPSSGGDPGGCCYICGTYFTRKTNIDKHLTTRHGVGIAQASFPCEVCGVSFLLMEYTRRHEKNIHHHKRQYRCGICRKMCFGYRHKLVEHLRTAHGGKGVVCAACGCAFKDVTLLERHYKRKHARASEV